MATCVECGRKFDLSVEQDSQEWSFGHDCEPTDPGGALAAEDAAAKWAAYWDANLDAPARDAYAAARDNLQRRSRPLF